MKDKIKKAKEGINKVVSGYKKFTDPAHKLYNKVEKTIYKEDNVKKKK